MGKGDRKGDTTTPGQGDREVQSCVAVLGVGCVVNDGLNLMPSQEEGAFRCAVVLHALFAWFVYLHSSVSFLEKVTLRKGCVVLQVQASLPLTRKKKGTCRTGKY